MTWVGIGLLAFGIISMAAKKGGVTVPFLMVIPTGASIGMSVAGGAILLLAKMTSMQSWLILTIALIGGIAWIYFNGGLSNFNQRRELIKAKNGGTNA